MPDFGFSIQYNPLYAILLAFTAGIITSLGPCNFVRAMLLVGYLGSDSKLSQSRGFALTSLFLVGIMFSYFLLGLAGFFAVSLFGLGTYMYYAAGVVAILGGLHFAEIIHLRLPSFNFATRLKEISMAGQGPVNIFLLGSAFGLMICPCCLPPIFAIFALTFAKGKLFYGTLLLSSFIIGHGLPLLAVGTFTGVLGMLKKIQLYRAFIGLSSGTLLVLTGLILIWIA